MKILIAGGAGYVGSALVPRLLERGYEIVVVDTLWFGNHLPEGIPVLEEDVFDLKEADIEGFDQLIFLAGLSNDPMAEYAPSRNFISNAAAPAYLGYLAKKAGIKRFIFAGSCSVYGYTVNKLYDETSPTVSSYPYGISKLQGEQAVIRMADEDFSVISLRKGTVCGYSPRMRLDLVVNTMFRSALENEEITVDNPEIWRPVVSIQDAVSAYIRAVEANQGLSGIFNITSGNYTVGEMGDIVKESLETALKARIRLNIKHKKDYRNYKVSIDKAMNILGYKPKHAIEDIVRELLDNLEHFKDFDNYRYSNIEVFRRLHPPTQA